VIPADSARREDWVRIRFRWPDEHEPMLERTLPLVLRAGRVQLVVAPGETAEVPPGPVVATAVVPGAAPLITELTPVDHDLLEVPFPASDVARATFGDSTTDKHPSRAAQSSIALDVTRWADAAAPIPEDNQLTISRDGDLLRIGGHQEISAPLRLVLAGRQTPTQVIAVPRVALDEEAVVHIGFDRPWGARPALMPSDRASRLLLAYLSSGENRLAATMARALARAWAQGAVIRWASPSFTQLLIGYAYALGEDADSLASWCHRTQAARYLGADGVILTAQSAWLLGQSQQATELLASAEATTPVMALGLGVAVRLAFHLAAEPGSAQVDFARIGHEGEQLARLVTSYSKLSAATDPVADTVTRPTSQRRPVTLEGSRWRQRAAWAIAYLLTRLRLAHTFKQPTGIPPLLVSLQKRANQALDHRGGAVRRTWNSWLFVAVPVTLVWAGILAAVVAYARSDSMIWDRLLVPLQGFQAAVFAVAGAGLILTVVNRRSRDLEKRAEDSERRARAAEEQAMKGRALAAALQDEASSTVVADPLAQHALLSRELFGDMIGRDAPEHDARAARDSEI
jgi:hypothetical protein